MPTQPEATAEATPDEVAAYLSEQQKEWGQYVAVAPIALNGVPAFNPGDAVPAGHVKKYGWADGGYVAKIGSAGHRKMAEGLNVTPEPAPPVSLAVPLPGQK